MAYLKTLFAAIQCILPGFVAKCLRKGFASEATDINAPTNTRYELFSIELLSLTLLKRIFIGVAIGLHDSIPIGFNNMRMYPVNDSSIWSFYWSITKLAFKSITRLNFLRTQCYGRTYRTTWLGLSSSWRCATCESLQVRQPTIKNLSPSRNTKGKGNKGCAGATPGPLDWL